MKRYDNLHMDIDEVRGVIYIHADNGTTLIRISGVEAPVPPIQDKNDVKSVQMLDIHVKTSFGVR